MWITCCRSAVKLSAVLVLWASALWVLLLLTDLALGRFLATVIMSNALFVGVLHLSLSLFSLRGRSGTFQQLLRWPLAAVGVKLAEPPSPHPGSLTCYFCISLLISRTNTLPWYTGLPCYEFTFFFFFESWCVVCFTALELCMKKIVAWMV